MNEDKNVKTVKDAYSAYQDRNMTALLGCLTEDVRWFAVGPPNLIPTAGSRKGREQVGEFFAVLEASEDVQTFKPQHFVSQGDTVVVLGELKSRVRSTGSLINSPWVHVFTIRDGKVSDFRSFYDTAAAVAAYEDVRSQTARAGALGPRRSALL